MEEHNQRFNRRNTTQSNSALPKSRRRFDECFPVGTRTIVKSRGIYYPLYIDPVRMEMNSLIRYVHYHNIVVPPACSKRQLSALVCAHLAMTPPVYEGQIISQFIKANHEHRKKLHKYQRF